VFTRGSRSCQTTGMGSSHRAQGEWFGESGPEVEIDIPGNGRPRLLDILVVLDGNYPHAHKWTTASRHAALRAYAIKANPIEVEIEVMAAGGTSSSPRLHNRLVIGLYDGKISADWTDQTADEASNWIPWDGPGRLR
jgi:hypothetical protein